MILKPIIPIKRASEELINFLIETRVLVVTETGIRVNENPLANDR